MPKFKKMEKSIFTIFSSIRQIDQFYTEKWILTVSNIIEKENKNIITKKKKFENYHGNQQAPDNG